MRVIVKNNGGPRKVTVQVQDEAGSAMESGDGTQVADDGVELEVGQEVTLAISDHGGGEPDLDHVAVGPPVIDPAPPLDAALTERGAAVAEKVRRAMAETPQPWNSGHLDRAISEALA